MARISDLVCDIFSSFATNFSLSVDSLLLELFSELFWFSDASRFVAKFLKCFWFWVQKGFCRNVLEMGENDLK